MPTDRDLMLSALGGMKLAGLKLYGAWPDNGRELAMKADIYVGTVQRRIGSLDNLKAATEWFIDRGTDFPSAKEFADRCKEIDAKAFMLVGRDMLDEDGNVIAITAKVRRGSAPGEITRALENRVRQALSEGYREIVPALPSPEAKDRLEAFRSGEQAIVRGIS